MTSITASPEWAALQLHYEEVRLVHLRRRFVEDAGRAADLSHEFDGIYLDLSKNRLTRETIELSARRPRERASPAASRPSLRGTTFHVLRTIPRPQR